MPRLIKLLWIALAVLAALFILSDAGAQSSSPRIIRLQADGPVAPAMGEYLERGIQVAEREGVEALIFQLNTPGGSVAEMNEMVQAMRASRVPIVVWIAPRGAFAASAGTLITLAGHASAMAPETTIGAASPIDASGQDLPDTVAAKEREVLKATIRSLASWRGDRAIALAEATIDDAKAASSEEALEAGLIDFIASDLDELLHDLDGVQVQVNGEAQTLDTAGAFVEDLNLSLIERLLQVLTNPNIVFLLLIIGVQAILIEMYSPGGWVAGFTGVVCLALAMYGMGIIPVNWFGLIFIATAFVLFILDVKAPTHGGLTAAGVGSLIVGALVLFNTPRITGYPSISIPLVVVMSSLVGVMFFGIVLVALRIRTAPIQTGQESLVGRVGTVRKDLAPRGIVQMGGESWTAEAVPGTGPLLRGTRVQVVQVTGVRLVVRPVQPKVEQPTSVDSLPPAS